MLQTNSQRIEFCISKKPLSKSILLNNGFWFSKIVKYDDYIRISQSQMTSILYTLMYIYLYNIPSQNITSILERNVCPQPTNLDFKDISKQELVDLADTVFGVGISKLLFCQIYKVYKLYYSNTKTIIPSVYDFMMLKYFLDGDYNIDLLDLTTPKYDYGYNQTNIKRL